MRLTVLRLGLVISAFAGCAGSATEPAEPDTTFLAFVSSPGDYLGADETHRYEFAQGSWLARYSGTTGPEVVFVSVRPLNSADTWNWALFLGAPSGQVLAPGTYENASRGAAPSAGGLDFFGSGRGCNTATGRFVIHSLALGPSNTISRLHVTFEEHCEGASPVLKGEISIRADPWR
jgi:hypothetical protein